MSRNHFAHRNFDWPTMLNLLCYNTEKPHLLSKKQQITRLYKNLSWTSFTRIFRGGFSENTEFYREDVNRRRKDFLPLFGMDRNSKEFKETMKKYEEYISDNYDVNMHAFDNQPHSLNSLKLCVFTDEVKSTDADL